MSNQLCQGLLSIMCASQSTCVFDSRPAGAAITACAVFMYVLSRIRLQVQRWVMAVSLDSKVVFKAHAARIGVETDVVDALVAAGIDTLAKLAFCSAYQPGGADDAPLIRVLRDALQADPNAGQKAVFRRLHFEASTMNLAEMKAKIDRSDESAPKRLPPAERSARYDMQVKKLTGLSLVGELECSNALIDEVFQQREDETVRYLAPEKCTKRESEILGDKKKETSLKVAAGGNLTVSAKEADLQADTSTELRVKYALMRRALAYDQCGLVDYETLASWSDYLYEQVMRPPPDNYRSISMDQALAADKALFICAARATRAGISPKPDGTKPLEDALVAARRDPQVAMLLMPLPKGGGGGGGGGSGGSGGAGNGAGPGKKVKQWQNKGDKGKGKGGKATKGSGKGKGKQGKFSKGPRMPEKLVGMHSMTPDGYRICYDFNLEGCSEGKAGQTCSKGKHCCCRPGCYKDHPLYECKHVIA